MTRGSGMQLGLLNISSKGWSQVLLWSNQWQMLYCVYVPFVCVLNSYSVYIIINYFLNIFTIFQYSTKFLKFITS